LFRKMEKLTNKGLIISPNVGTLPVSGQADDSSKDSSEDSSPQSDTSISMASSASCPSSQTTTTERKKDAKWSKNTQAKSQLPMNLISTTNQEKVSSVPVKQQIPLKLASRLSSGAAVATGAGGPTQMLPLKLSQDEKIRRTSTSGYQRLSPPSGETTPTMTHSHSRTGSSPAMMQASSPGPTHQHTPTNAKAARTHTYPKIQDKFKQSSGDEEVIYF
jgi:hypothetical protein